MHFEEALGLPRRIFQHCLARKRIGLRQVASRLSWRSLAPSAEWHRCRVYRSPLCARESRKAGLEPSDLTVVRPSLASVAVFSFFSTQPHDPESDSRSCVVHHQPCRGDNRQSLSWPGNSCRDFADWALVRIRLRANRPHVCCRLARSLARRNAPQIVLFRREP